MLDNMIKGVMGKMDSFATISAPLFIFILISTFPA